MQITLLMGVSKEPALSPSKGPGPGDPQKNTVGQIGRQEPIGVSDTTDMDKFHENRAT